MYVKKSKCNFVVQEIEYLGHFIFGEGMKTDPTKLKSMIDWSIPKSFKSLKGFLGLTRYYKKFIRNSDFLAISLTELLKKRIFHWNS